MIQIHEIHDTIVFVPFYQRKQCQKHMSKDMASPHLSQWRKGRYGRSAHSAELCRFAAQVQINGQIYCRRHAADLLMDLVLSSDRPDTMVLRGEMVAEVHVETSGPTGATGPVDPADWVREGTVVNNVDMTDWPVMPLEEE